MTDLDRAARDLSRTVGVRWGPVRDGRLGEWDFRIVFSTAGPPFLELIEGPAGSPWDATSGSRFDHLGYWSSDLGADSPDLVARGATVDFDACPFGRRFTYLRLDSIGARIELVDAAGQAAFIDTWSPGGGRMPTLELPDNEDRS